MFSFGQTEVNFLGQLRHPNLVKLMDIAVKMHRLLVYELCFEEARKHLFRSDETHVSTRVMGTYGYAAPEYVMTGTSLFLYAW
ncbi:hypothetical protein HU200_002275 [Digitaria exilis]|uniref:Protein kinase domain-containing protein n=1 Tax=Digitaria exilis TaxID=1010633 RepID=A0A835FW03_9POAL|nr:hypothetical protein HU200_002275 [Digitaria exilis]